MFGRHNSSNLYDWSELRVLHQVDQKATRTHKAKEKADTQWLGLPEGQPPAARSARRSALNS